MKILHVFRHPPDGVTRQLVEILSREREATEFPLHITTVDYDHLLHLILTHDQVVSWW
ncbi:MAG: hypothetical protein Q8M54_09635 [Desulfobaccales bacterium]|nr:hypothetical protein [Desulfobaccales bacterium]